MKDEKTLIEWAILIGLFNATVEQTSQLTRSNQNKTQKLFLTDSQRKELNFKR
jgi:hypothetical protein